MTALSQVPPFFVAFVGLRLANRWGLVEDMISVDLVLSEARTTYSLANSLVWEAERIAHSLKRRSIGLAPFTKPVEISDFADVMAKMRDRYALLSQMESKLLAAMHLIARGTAVDDEDPLQLNMIATRFRTGDSAEEWRRLKRAPRAHFELTVDDQGCAAQGVAGLNFETGEDLKRALDIVAGFRALQAARRALLMADRRIKEHVYDLVGQEEPAPEKQAVQG